MNPASRRGRFIAPTADLSALIRINLTKWRWILRRGEGSGAARGGPLWSPDVLVPLHHHVINKLGYAGDHKGPPNPSQPPSPLRIARLLGQAKGSISLYTTLVHLLKLNK